MLSYLSAQLVQKSVILIGLLFSALQVAHCFIFSRRYLPQIWAHLITIALLWAILSIPSRVEPYYFILYGLLSIVVLGYHQAAVNSLD